MSSIIRHCRWLKATLAGLGICLALVAAADMIDFTGIFPANIKTIYIVAPSSHADNDTIIAATNEFVRCGYKVKVADTVWTYSDNAAVRARDIEKAWQDPETDLIICSRGGSGGATTVANLNFDILKSRDIPFVGFSNISALMNAFVAKGVKRPITGPLCTSLVTYPNTRESVLRLGATVGRYDLDSTQLTVLRAPAAAVSGKPIGGHWPSIAGLSSEFLPDTTGRIAFLEINDKTYDYAVETFEVLKKQGYFSAIAALVLCNMNMSATEKARVTDYLTTNVTCAVFSGYPYGHIAQNFAIDFDRTATITPQGLLSWESYSFDVAFDAAAGERTNVTETLVGPLNVYVNTNGTGTVCLSGANTYEGTTTLGGGTLEVPLLAATGNASALGQEGPFKFQGGTFRYTGTEAATFNRAVTFGPNACTLENEADLNLSGQWTKSGSPSFFKTGNGTITFTQNNSFYGITNRSGTIALAGGKTAIAKDLTFDHLVFGDETVKTRLLVSKGTHTISGTFYIGQHDVITNREFWSDFIMTGGKLTVGGGVALGWKDYAHINMDISGGTLTIKGNLSTSFEDTSTPKDIAITIRDSGVVKITSTGKRFYVYNRKSQPSLTVKDGGTFQPNAIVQYNKSTISPLILFDGGNIIWGSTNYVFNFNGAQLKTPIRIGTKGATFTGISAQQPYVYDVAFVATNTVDGMAAQGVSFAKGIYSLEKANSWEGPTRVRSGTTVMGTVAGALPETSRVIVEEGGTLAVTSAGQTCAGLVLTGRLDVVQGQTLTLGEYGLTGQGRITLYTDSARTAFLSAAGTYPVLTVPLAQRAALENYAETIPSGNGGRWSVESNGITATLALVLAETTDQPDCLVEGTNAASTIVFQCCGAVEEVDNVKYVKPGWAARLSAKDTTGGLSLAGWRDETTGEFYWGPDAVVMPTNYTTYTAVFGPAWNWNATSKTLSNGIWTFTAAVDSDDATYLIVTNVTTVPSDVSVLNFATPVTDTAGTTFTLARIGQTASDKTLFGLAGYAKAQKVGGLYLGEGMTQVGVYAFSNCSNLTGCVSTPKGLTIIADYAFYSCANLQMANLPGVLEIRDGAFQRCAALTTVRLSNDLRLIAYYAFNGDSQLSCVTPLLPDAVEEVGRSAFYTCSSLVGDLRLKNAKRICYSAFASGPKFTTVTLLSVTNLGYNAFYGVPATNYVFGTARVGFDDEFYQPTHKSYHGWGYQTFYYTGTQVRHFIFPGLAPDLRVVMPGSRAACTNRVFGSANQKGRTILHGSWRIDPQGWNRILNEMGSADISGKTPAAVLLPNDRRVKGYFQWYYKSNSIYWGWLVDMAVDGEPLPGYRIIFR